MPNPTPQSIVEKLSEAQRQALLEAGDGYLRSKHMLTHIVRGLVDCGLLPPRVRGLDQDNRLTRLGQGVRAILSRKEQNDG